MVNNFVHIQIGVTNLDEAIEFYRSIFEWKIYKSEAMRNTAIFEIDENEEYVGGGLTLTETQPSTGTMFLYVNTSDIDVTLNKIIANGGNIVLQKSKLPGDNGFIARFQDPFGNVLGLWSQNE